MALKINIQEKTYAYMKLLPCSINPRTIIIAGNAINPVINNKKTNSSLDFLKDLSKLQNKFAFPVSIVFQLKFEIIELL